MRPDPIAPAAHDTSTTEVHPDVIVIDDLVVEASIGLLDFERVKTQRVKFDIAVTMICGYREKVAETGEIFSYADPIEFIRQKSASGEHVDLVEEWAEDVAAFVLKSELVASVKVKVTKPDIFPEAGGVGIVITRTRAR